MSSISELRIPVWETDLALSFPTDWQLRPDAERYRSLMKATEILASALVTMAGKDVQYGEAWREQGWRGNLARILSKAARLRAMLWRKDPVEGAEESVEDTLLDLINLAIFMLLNRRSENEWGRNA